MGLEFGQCFVVWVKYILGNCIEWCCWQVVGCMYIFYIFVEIEQVCVDFVGV